MKTKLAALVAGLLFGFGLALAGMTDTARVLGFLDFTGDWDPALIFVLAFAVVSTYIGYRIILKRAKPLFAHAFALSTNRVIDTRLLIGASIFGVGWGLYGYCPGPALAALVYLQWQTYLFVAAMVLGSLVANQLLTRDEQSCS